MRACAPANAQPVDKGLDSYRGATVMPVPPIIAHARGDSVVDPEQARPAAGAPLAACHRTACSAREAGVAHALRRACDPGGHRSIG